MPRRSMTDDHFFGDLLFLLFMVSCSATVVHVNGHSLNGEVGMKVGSRLVFSSLGASAVHPIFNTNQ